MHHGEGLCPVQGSGAETVGGRPDYDLIFRGLRPCDSLAEGRLAALAELCSAMCVGDAPLAPDHPENNPDIPAGYTYFGQLVTHDLTFFTTRRRQPSTATGGLSNASLSTPSLDLDCIYGLGPRGEPLLYEPCEEGRDHPRYLLRTGPLTEDGRPRDLPRLTEVCPGLAGGRPEISADPLIPDRRNDDHLIISQLHLVFVRLHNRIARLLKADGISNEEAFVQARRFVELSYRNVIRRDYLRRLLCDEVYADLLSAEPRFLFLPDDSPIRGSGAFLPLEFALAAGRYGHSMVRGSYPVNDHLDRRARLHDLLGFCGSEKQPRFEPELDLPVRESWMIDWTNFFGLDGTQAVPSRRIQPMLTRDLFGRRPLAGSDGLRFVGQADLLRSSQWGLPSGQTIARAIAEHAAGHLEVPVLTGERMMPAAYMADRPRRHAPLTQFLDRHRDFLEETPLFYYVLQEAAVLGEGRRLGPVGSFVVGLAFKSVLPEDPMSDRRAVASMPDVFQVLASDDFTAARLLRDELEPLRRPEPAGAAH